MTDEPHLRLINDGTEVDRRLARRRGEANADADLEERRKRSFEAHPSRLPK